MNNFVVQVTLAQTISAAEESVHKHALDTIITVEVRTYNDAWEPTDLTNAMMEKWMQRLIGSHFIGKIVEDASSTQFSHAVIESTGYNAFECRRTWVTNFRDVSYYLGGLGIAKKTKEELHELAIKFVDEIGKIINKGQSELSTTSFALGTIKKTY